jgi:hypothetical protein
MRARERGTATAALNLTRVPSFGTVRASQLSSVDALLVATGCTLPPRAWCDLRYLPRKASRANVSLVGRLSVRDGELPVIAVALGTFGSIALML